MFKDVIRYSNERSPSYIVLPLAAALYSSGFDSFPTLATYIAGLVCVSLFLFLVRLSDDICDIPIDNITHPERLLPSGELNISKLNIFRAIVIVVMLMINYDNNLAMLFLALTCLVYFVFFLAKPHLPTMIHVLLLNSTLAVFPLYAGLLTPDGISPFHLLLGMFFWLGGFAHDLSHSVIDTSNTDPKKLNPINHYNQKAMAINSFIVFTIAFLAGVFMYMHDYVTTSFIITLIIAYAILLKLELQLIQKPNEENAKPFYIFGFLFFLVPGIANAISLYLR